MSEQSGFYVSIDLSQFLTIRQIWPDGDEPRNPTAKDVVEIINKYGTVTSFIREWDMAIDSRVMVDAEPTSLR